MFGLIGALFSLIGGIIGGVFRLVTGCLSGCFGITLLVIAFLAILALMVFGHFLM